LPGLLKITFASPGYSTWSFYLVLDTVNDYWTGTGSVPDDWQTADFFGIGTTSLAISFLCIQYLSQYFWSLFINDNHWAYPFTLTCTPFVVNYPVVPGSNYVNYSINIQGD